MSFWRWLISRLKEEVMNPYTVGILIVAVGVSLAIYDVVLFAAGKHEPVLLGSSLYGLASLPLVAIGLLLMAYGYWREFVAKRSQ